MSAIEAALDRGRQAAPRNSKWEPADVTYRGRLVAVVKNRDSDQLERVYRFRGALLFEELGRLADGTVTVHAVRDRALKKIALAMLGGEKERDALVGEGWEKTKAALAGSAPTKRVRRGAKK